MSMRSNSDNNSLSIVSTTESDNELNSSFNRHNNESMMHKVKDVVSKFFHPSFLFSTNNESESSKRKRSTSVEMTIHEQKPVRTTTSKSNIHRSSIEDEEPQITDDEDDDDNSKRKSHHKSTIEHEQQTTKRRRIGNYQSLISNKPINGHEIDGRTSSTLLTTDSMKSLSNQSIHPTTTFTSNINRLITTKQFDIQPITHCVTTNYDPTKSPLFAVGARQTNESNGNYLLAESLASNSNIFSKRNPSTIATLSNPNGNRQLFASTNYSPMHSRRLPYIERLRRRTLQESIRLNRTADSQPLSISINEEQQSTTTTIPTLKRSKIVEKECGIQCDILTESTKNQQRTLPPSNIRHEALSVPVTSIQTNSSITIESNQPSISTINTIKPKLLGNITPFSWPKFARAQEEYVKNNPEKCRLEPPSKTNVSTMPTLTSPSVQMNNIGSLSKLPIYPFVPLRTAETIWKCPTCTKEHPAQTASCSVCRGINPNYKKPSAIQPTSTVGKQFNPPKSVTSTIVTTTKENRIAPISTTATRTLPSLIVTTKESSGAILPAATFSFAATSPLSSKETPVTSSSSITLPFGTRPIVSTPPTTSITTPTKTSTTTSSTPTSFAFGVTTSISSFQKETPTFPDAPPVFGLPTTTETPKVMMSPSITTQTTTTTENPATTTTAATFSFGTATGTIAPFQFGTSIFSTFGTATSASTSTTTTSTSTNTTATTTSILPAFDTTTSTSTTATTPSTVAAATSMLPTFDTTTSASTATTTTPSTVTKTTSSTIAPFGSTVASTTVSTSAPPLFIFAPSASTSTGTGTSSAMSGTSTNSPDTATTTSVLSFPTPTTASVFPSTSSLTVTPSSTAEAAATTTSASPTPFGTSTFGTTTAPTPFGTSTFGATTAPTPFGTNLFGTTTTTAAATFSFGTGAFTSTPTTSSAAPATVPFGTSSFQFTSPTTSSPSFGTVGFNPTGTPTTTSTVTSSLATNSFISNPTSNATSSATPAFGTGGFSFAPSSTTSASTAAAPFAFGENNPSASSSATTTPASFGGSSTFGTNTSFGQTSFGTITPFGQPTPSTSNPVSSSSSFGASAAAPAFSFGASSTNSPPSSAGFGFPPTPVFGAPPAALSAGALAAPFIFGAPPSATTSSASSTLPSPLPLNPFVPSSLDDQNQFSITETSSNPPGARRQLTARRRIRPP